MCHFPGNFLPPSGAFGPQSCQKEKGYLVKCARLPQRNRALINKTSQSALETELFCEEWMRVTSKKSLRQSHHKSQGVSRAAVLVEGLACWKAEPPPGHVQKGVGTQGEGEVPASFQARNGKQLQLSIFHTERV